MSNDEEKRRWDELCILHFCENRAIVDVYKSSIKQDHNHPDLCQRIETPRSMLICCVAGPSSGIGV